MKTQENYKIIVCFCRGLHDSLKDFNLWEYVNEVSQIPQIECVSVIPMACSTNIPNSVKKDMQDGKNFLKHFIKDGEKYILCACDRETQRKRLKENCEELGINFENAFHSVDIRFINASEGVKRTNKLLYELSINDTRI